MVNTMNELSPTTSFEDLLLASASITDVVGNLLQVSILTWKWLRL